MKKAIHVIEDDADIGELIAFLLTEQGYEVCVFSDLASFRLGNNSDMPALLIVDIMLPDGDGLEICEEWKSNPATHHIPILLMSAYEDYKHDERAKSADGFISKPFDIIMFLASVQSMLK